jgi:hypothetical protein
MPQVSTWKEPLDAPGGSSKRYSTLELPEKETPSHGCAMAPMYVLA